MLGTMLPMIWMKFFLYRPHIYSLHLFFANIFISPRNYKQTIYIHAMYLDNYNIVKSNKNRIKYLKLYFIWWCGRCTGTRTSEIKNVELIFFSWKEMSRLNTSCSTCAFNVNKSFALFVEKFFHSKVKGSFARKTKGLFCKFIFSCR